MNTERKTHRAQPGTLFACSWGYDQTNVDYYVVLSATPKMAYIARIKQGDVEYIGREVAAGRGHKLPNGTLERLGRFKIHDAAIDGRDALRDIESRYALWFAPYSFANAYWWRGEELYSTPFGQGH